MARYLCPARSTRGSQHSSLADLGWMLEDCGGVPFEDGFCTMLRGSGLSCVGSNILFPKDACHVLSPSFQKGM